MLGLRLPAQIRLSDQAKAASRRRHQRRAIGQLRWLFTVDGDSIIAFALPMYGHFAIHLTHHPQPARPLLLRTRCITG